MPSGQAPAHGALHWMLRAGLEILDEPEFRHRIRARADGIDKPVAVRFGWHQEAEPNLANAEGLPASPFRTDDWE